MGIILNEENATERGTLHGLNPGLYPALVQEISTEYYYLATKGAGASNIIGLTELPTGKTRSIDLDGANHPGKHFRVLSPNEKLILANGKSTRSYF